MATKTEAEIRESVARLEAKLIGGVYTRTCEDRPHWRGIFDHDCIIVPVGSGNQHRRPLDHTSAKGERWFAEKLCMAVRPTAGSKHTWDASVPQVGRCNHFGLHCAADRSTAIRMAIEAAALEEMKP